MGIFDGDFGADDAAIIGGIMGFAEEAIRDENRELDELDIDDMMMDSRIEKDIDLASFRRSYPELFKHILYTIVVQKYRWARNRRQEQLDLESVKDELDALARTEALLDEG